ncbi:hypothetical protein M758_4G182900 [Ceratodon purpureus]|uniref:Uncharacterized protein n=1 Tax=Ceratodon purpureus TaxID=3225 RepID=A0A8T0IC19_CERPU|nr:hypothetical protein KC19_4G180400 [Ceratodon purpureus]KAG0620020.1 hypothetical protein M758_4G182900 [Ceratodon purpureus]
MGRPELREVQSVGSVLKQAGQLFRICVVPICILALVSAIYSYTLETYALSPSLAFAQLDVNYSMSQKVNSSLGQSRNSQDLKTSRVNFEGGLKEGSDDKGFVAKYLAMFLTSLDEAVMESLAESREKMSAHDSGAGDSRTASLKRDASQANYRSQDSEASQTSSEASAGTTGEESSEEVNSDNGGGETEPIPKFSLKLRVLGKNESSEVEDINEEKVGLGAPSARLMGGRNVDRPVPPLGLTLLFMLGVLAGALMAFCAVIMLQHAALLGTVAYSVISAYTGKQVGVIRAVKSGFRLGMIRLVWLAVLHGTIRDLMCLFVMKSFVGGGVLEPEKVDRLVLRLSLMPFSILAPFTDVEATSLSLAARIGGFVSIGYIIDGTATCIYVMACWVTIMERQYWGFAALSRGWRLVSTMQGQVIAIKLLESILCGRSARWVLSLFMGNFLSLLVVSVGQLYFVVCWLVLYLSARCKQDTNPRFSLRVLEDFLDRVR